MASLSEQRFIRVHFSSLGKALSLLAACLLSSCHYALGQQSSEVINPLAIEGTAEALDADTLLLNDQKIQLFGIITPDLTTPIGRSAHAWLNEKIREVLVRCKPLSAPDTYPIVAQCWRGASDISEALLRGGFALPDPGIRTEAAGEANLLRRYKRAEREARSNRAGLWSQEPIAIVSELKDWQTLFAGALAIVAAIVSFWAMSRQSRTQLNGMKLQIEAAQNVEATRSALEKVSLIRALSAELYSTMTYISRQYDDLCKENESIVPSRLVESIPPLFPVFSQSVSKIGLLDIETAGKIIHAYFELIILSHRFKSMAEKQPTGGIAILKAQEPLSEIKICLDHIRNAHAQISRIDK